MVALYEDAHLVICVKPRGVLSAPDASGRESMASVLAPRTIFPVHRLDREVGGIMVFAKTRGAAASLSAAMGDSFIKEYLALCEDACLPDEGVFEDLLFHDRLKNKTYIAKRKRSGVKDAKLAYRVLCRTENGHALVRVRLYTGRTHQIRVQFASRHCPLYGDRKYGAKTNGTIELVAWRLTFPHPSEHRLVSVSLPQEFFPPGILSACKSSGIVL